MRKIKFYIIIFLISIPALGQVSDIKMHSFSGTLNISVDGGFTISKTDYPEPQLGGRIIGGIEYYLPVSGIHIFGIRGFGGGQQINNKADNKIITLPGTGPVQLPDIINTDMYIAGIAAIYSLSINDKLFPFFSTGVSNLWYNPRNSDGSRAANNARNLYSKKTIEYDFEAGIKYTIADNFNLKLEGGFHFPNSDNLDDIETGINNDFYATFNLGISYSFFGIKDNDKDKIPDNIDQCPDEPEDYDGYMDDDGCPDPDNDGDGIPDILDKCPDTPEDFDGFRDEDGCQDIDNDLDGILDEFDECPDEAEDIDGFQDDDGCPDNDNDEDGILDVEDKCPDEAGLRSLSGCPGNETDPENYIAAPKEIIIESEVTFLLNKPDIKPEAFPELNRIVKILELYPEIEWRIEAHTDTEKSQNLMVRPLSLRRAESILNYFISQGLPSFQFKVYDMGDNFPIANNNTEYGRMKNRRVVLVREN